MPPRTVMAIRPPAAWVPILAAVFGGITLLGLIAFALIGAVNPSFVCSAYSPLAAVFALGSALSVGFIGGAASLTTDIGPSARNSGLVLSAGGGVAVLIGILVVFQQFKPDTCGQQEAMSESTILSLRSQLAAANLQLDGLKKKTIDFVITPDSVHALPLNAIFIQYYDTFGNPQQAQRNGNTYSIPIEHLLFTGDITVNYNAAALAAQDNSSENIPIEKIGYATSTGPQNSTAIQIRLWLADPRGARRSQ